MKKITLLFVVSLMMFVIACSKADEIKNSVAPQKDTYPIYNDINYAGSNIELEKYIENIANQLRLLKNTNSDLSDNEMNLFVNEAISKSEIISTNRNTKISYTDITNRLNSQELALYNSNIAKAILCMANGVFANSYTESNYINTKTVLHNGNGDAFRHVLWNYGMTIDVGSIFAKKWSDAHEYGASPLVLVERTMDLYNNGIGIQLGKDNPSTKSHSVFISNSKTKVRGGKCLILKNSRYFWSDSYGEK